MFQYEKFFILNFWVDDEGGIGVIKRHDDAFSSAKFKGDCYLFLYRQSK